MAWFRLHTNILNSRKIKTLPDKTFRAWIESMAIARDHGGELPALSDYAYEMRISEDRARTTLDDLQSRVLVDRTEDGTLVMHDWEFWQFEDVKITTGLTNAQRQKRYRDRKKNSNGVTLCTVTDNVTNVTNSTVTNGVTSNGVTFTRARTEQNITEHNRNVTRNGVTVERNTPDNCEEIFHRILKRHAENYRHAMKTQMIVDAWMEALAKRPDDPQRQAEIIDKAHIAACDTPNWRGKFREALDKWLARGGYMDDYPAPEDDGIESAKEWLAREAARAQGD